MRHLKKILFTFFTLLIALRPGYADENFRLSPPFDPFTFDWQRGTFQQYIQTATEHIKKNRVFIHPDNQEFEIQANAPFEIAPSPLKQCQAKKKRGILLIHGLGDSPFSKRDIANNLSNDCFLVRTILLEGHGTRAGETLTATAQNWLETAKFGIRTLKEEVDEVYVGGISTGANLSAILAFQDPEIKGLALFSPAFKLQYEFEHLVAFIDIFIDWLSKEDEGDYAKYSSLSVNALRQFYVTSEWVQDMINQGKTLDIPVFIALSQNDSIVDVEFIKQTFIKSIRSEKSRMMLFSPSPKVQVDKRIFHFDGSSQTHKILALSHMSIQSSPDNPHYGKNPDYRNCYIFDDEQNINNCRNAGLEDIWWGTHGTVREQGKIYGQVTFNPYFSEMMEQVRQTLNVFVTNDLKN